MSHLWCVHTLKIFTQEMVPAIRRGCSLVRMHSLLLELNSNEKIQTFLLVQTNNDKQGVPVLETEKILSFE